MRLKKLAVTLFTALIISTTTVTVVTPPLITEAHSGRTDSRGGHKDNKNKSGLGSYHYHCGGYPAHLHPNGVCPYSNSSSVTSSSNSNENFSYKSSMSSVAPSDSQQNNDVYVTTKYKLYTDDYNNKVTSGYFRQDVNEAVTQFISNPSNTSYINSLLTNDELTDLLSGNSSIVKYDILSKILYTRVYEIMLQQIELQNPSESQVIQNNTPEQNSMRQDDFVFNLVVKLQTQLTLLGYYTGSIDGVFDIETQQSLINFQNAYGLIPDGTINQQVVDALNIQM